MFKGDFFMKIILKICVVPAIFLFLNGIFIYQVSGDDKTDAKKAYVDYITAVADQNMEKVKQLLTAPLLKDLETGDSKKKLAELKQKTPSRADIFGSSVLQKKATLLVDGYFNGKKVSGTVYMVLEEGKWKFSVQQFDEEFDNIPVSPPLKPVKEPVSQPDKIDKKPSGVEEALKTLYDNFRKAMSTGKFEELKKYLSASGIKEMEEMGNPQDMMSMAAGFMPTEFTVTDVLISGDEGTLSFEGKIGTQEGEGTVECVKEAGEWKVKKHHFSVGRKPKQKPVAELAGLPGKIAFISNRDGSYEVYVMNPDGSRPKQITKTGGFKDYLAWSPDATKIVFDSHSISEDSDLYCINADGSGLVRLTNNDAEDRAPVWSPDGRWIAFTSSTVEKATEDSRSYNPPNICVIRPDGSGFKQITTGKNGSENISWLKNSSRLIYRSNKENRFRIYSVSPDGGEETGLTAGDDWDDYPACSPIEDLILFFSGSKLWAMDADGGNKTKIEIEKTDKKPVIWSPDGARVLVRASPNGFFSTDICVINPDGSGFKNLTNSKEEEELPSWSPDGRWILCSKSNNICVIEIESGKIYQVTNGGDISKKVFWSPK
jgi:TolB protein